MDAGAEELRAATKLDRDGPEAEAIDHAVAALLDVVIDHVPLEGYERPLAAYRDELRAT